MKRRDFLKNIVYSSCAGSVLMASPFAGLQAAQTRNNKTLVVIFQRGGCDGLNTCVPYGDDNYYALRPTIAIAPPDITNAKSAINLDGYFGLHPGLASLKSIFDNGNLAILPATHYPDSTHSHFDGQHFIETAAAVKSKAGWLNRYLKQVDGNSSLRAVAFANQLPQSFNGEVPVSVISDLDVFKLSVATNSNDEMFGTLHELYSQSVDVSKAYHNRLQKIGRRMIDDAYLLRNHGGTSYAPNYGAVYPDSNYGKQLKQTAQLIKANLGLEVVSLELEGWDTHASQGGGEAAGYQFGLHQEFSDGIAAFYHDLGSHMNDVVVLTCTEFGRTAKENASGGTDHGDASSWFVIGGSVNGGIYGEWPGLAADQLRGGRYLSYSIDYRNVLGDILTNHLSVGDVSPILFGHDYQSVGLFS